MTRATPSAVRKALLSGDLCGLSLRRTPAAPALLGLCIAVHRRVFEGSLS
jgi:hypothetical protein